MIFRVGDIKQYFYCPRIVYYTYVVLVDRKTTSKMAYGKEEHLEFERLERRRKLTAYGLDKGERRFRTRLYSERLGLEGTLDLHLVTPAGYFPVEVKNSAAPPGLNHKYQLVSYAMLLEDAYNKPVRTGFLYFLPGRRVYPVDITSNARLFVRRVIARLRHMVERELFPPPPARTGRCRDCEYRNYCGDVV